MFPDPACHLGFAHDEVLQVVSECPLRRNAGIFQIISPSQNNLLQLGCLAATFFPCLLTTLDILPVEASFKHIPNLVYVNFNFKSDPKSCQGEDFLR